MRLIENNELLPKPPVSLIRAQPPVISPAFLQQSLKPQAQGSHTFPPSFLTYTSQELTSIVAWHPRPPFKSTSPLPSAISQFPSPPSSPSTSNTPTSPSVASYSSPPNQPRQTPTSSLSNAPPRNAASPTNGKSLVVAAKRPILRYCIRLLGRLLKKRGYA